MLGTVGLEGAELQRGGRVGKDRGRGREQSEGAERRGHGRERAPRIRSAAGGAKPAGASGTLVDQHAALDHRPHGVAPELVGQEAVVWHIEQGQIGPLADLEGADLTAATEGDGGVEGPD